MAAKVLMTAVRVRVAVTVRVLHLCTKTLWSTCISLCRKKELGRAKKRNHLCMLREVLYISVKKIGLRLLKSSV